MKNTDSEIMHFFDRGAMKKEIIKELKKKKLSQSDIAIKYGVSRQYISQIKKRHAMKGATDERAD
ncbi:MAG: helix-turn-helix domain-containing protein [Clostridia bacterium]|nr:helix-turn-helix domain-containing protein [Clostridia bacterium]